MVNARAGNNSASEIYPSFIKFSPLRGHHTAWYSAKGLINAGNRPVEFGTWELYPALTINCQAGDLLHHLLRKREDASRAIGLPWPNPAASNEKLASSRWLTRPSSKFSKPTGSPRPIMFVHTSAGKPFDPDAPHLPFGTAASLLGPDHDLPLAWHIILILVVAQPGRKRDPDASAGEPPVFGKIVEDHFSRVFVGDSQLGDF